MSITAERKGKLFPRSGARRGWRTARSACDSMPRNNPDGIVDTAVTRFVAGLRQKANDALARDAQARADYFDAVRRRCEKLHRHEPAL